MAIQVVLVDINPKMVKAWRDVFEDEPDVTIVHGSMLDQDVDAWVSPTNSQGNMDGGLDAVIKGRLGAKVEARLKQEIARTYGGLLPLGHATCVETVTFQPRYL